jgi:hypothetical protein
MLTIAGGILIAVVVMWVGSLFLIGTASWIFRDRDKKPKVKPIVDTHYAETDRIRFAHNQQKAAEDMAYAARHMASLSR